MDKRTEIALLYNYTPSWMGGVYYIQNIIYALNQLPDEKKPKVHVYCNEESRFYELEKLTKYPYLCFHRYRFNKNKFIKLINLGISLLSKYKYKPFGCIDLSASEIKAIYPANYESVRPTKKMIGWVPDFQDKYMPELFSKRGLAKRELEHKRLFMNNIPIVFSSHDAENDFHKFYPESKTKTEVLHFAASHPDFSNVDYSELKERFGINKKYFFCANQFWMHKNHLFLFKAFKKFLDYDKSYQLICSGALSDDRNKAYSDEIRNFISENNLENDIKIIGFVKRTEQLCLMANSYSIIQPSLFEGWSTVVEDAKALNKFIFLSDLNVHIEQKPENVSYFNPRSEEDLIEKLRNVSPTSHIHDYNQSVKEFGQNFINIIDELKD